MHIHKIFYSISLFFVFTFCLVTSLFAQQPPAHQVLRITLAPGNAYNISLGQGATSIALEYPAGDNPEGAYVLPRLVPGKYFIKDATEGEEINPLRKVSNLIVFRDVVKNITLYSGKLSGEVTIHIMYAAKIKLEKAGIISRSQQPCDRPVTIDQSEWRKGLPAPKVAPTATQVKHVIVHHTDTPNDDSDYTVRVRNIYLYHTQVNGWDDIGYNFLVAPNGVIYDGRDGMGAIEDDNVKGAHLCAKNTNTMGIAMLGTFMDTVPTDTAMASLKRLAVWKLNKENLHANDSSLHPVGDPNATELKVLAGHRDGCATDCPGDKLYSLLPALRNAVELTQANCAPFTVSVAEQLQPLKGLHIYPQPAGDHITITLPEDRAGTAVYTLKDISGRMLRSGSVGENINGSISLSGLPAGCYLISVQCGADVFRSTLLKQ